MLLTGTVVMTKLPQCLAGPVVGLFAVVFSAAAVAILPPSSTVRPPPFTDSQVSAGARVFADHCASCHGGDLQGAAGLSGWLPACCAGRA